MIFALLREGLRLELLSPGAAGGCAGMVSVLVVWSLARKQQREAPKRDG
jgi:hypothetical protein